jgi:hypothetical protein
MSGGRIIIDIEENEACFDTHVTRKQARSVPDFVTRVRLSGFGPPSKVLRSLPAHVTMLILECQRDEKSAGKNFSFLTYLPASITRVHIACKITSAGILNISQHIHDITYDPTLPANTIHDIKTGFGMRHFGGNALLKRKEPPVVHKAATKPKRPRIGEVIDLTQEPESLPSFATAPATMFAPKPHEEMNEVDRQILNLFGDEEADVMDAQVLDYVDSEWSETPPSSPRR